MSEKDMDEVSKSRPTALEAEIQSIQEDMETKIKSLTEDVAKSNSKKAFSFRKVFKKNADNEEKKQQSPQQPNTDDHHNVEKTTTEILKSLDGVRNKVKADKDDEHGKFRRTLRNTVKCINVLGDRVAGAASIAFSSAPSCFNAIGFFLQFYLDHEDMLDKLKGLLDQCNYIIGRVHIYKDNLTGQQKGPNEGVVELRLIAAKLLHAYIRVLCLSVSLHSHSKFTLLLKKGFLGVDEVDDLMNEMNNLVHEENNVLTALSFSNIHDVQQVLEQQKNAETAQGWRQAISKALGFEGDDPQPVWSRSLKEIVPVSGTGSWLWERSYFKTWSTPNAEGTVKPALILQGIENTGKTYMMANIVRHLEEAPTDRVVAYYFHGKTSDMSTGFNRTLEFISCSLLWQCATSSESLIKSLASKCQQMGYNPCFLDAWNQLLLQNKEINHIKRTFYLLIDGLEDGLLKRVFPLLERLAKSKDQTFRIFLSTRSSSLSAHFDPSLYSYYHIQQNNNQDIELFIKHRLRSMPAFDDTKHPKAQSYREKILRTVHEATKGDFEWTSIILDRLRSKHYLADIDEVLEGVHKPREEQVRKEIEMFNKTRAPEEIQEMNEAIRWLLTAPVAPSLDNVTAALNVNGYPDSLMPLQSRLKPLLDADEYGRIHFRLNEFRDYVLNHEKSINTQKTDIIIANSTSLEKEKETVHRFLKYVVPMKDYDKAKLEKILWRELSTSASLGYNQRNAHVEMAMTCLRALTSESDNTEKLRLYAGDYILYHLEQADPKTTDKNYKEDIERSLVKLLTDPNCIDSLFWTRAEHMSHQTWTETEGKWLMNNRKRWLYTPDGMTQLARWLKNSINQVAEEAEDKDSTYRHDKILRHAAERIAHHLFVGNAYTRREQLTAIHFLNGYVSRVDVYAKTIDPKEVPVSDCSHVKYDRLLRIRDWAENSIDDAKNKDEDGWWFGDLQVVRGIFAVSSSDEKAIQKADSLREKIFTDKRNPWEGNILGSLTAAKRKSFQAKQIEGEGASKAEELLEEARDILTRAISKCSPKKGLTSSESILVADTFLELGDIHWKLKKFADAAKIQRKSLSYSNTRYARYVQSFSNYRKRQDWNFIEAFFNDLLQGEPFSKAYLNRLVHDFIVKEEFQESLSGSHRRKERKELVDKFFEKALLVAKDSPADMFHIEKAYGQILFRLKEINRTNVAARWERSLEHGRPLAAAGDIRWHDLFSVINPLVEIYIQQGLKAPETISSENDKNQLAIHYLEKIQDLEQKTDVWTNSTVYCGLAHFHYQRKDENKARKAVTRIIDASIAILSDNDLSNDWFAFLHLGKVFSALGDMENAKTAWEGLDNIGRQQSDLLLPLLCAKCSSNISLSDGLRICLHCFGPAFFDKKCYDEEKAQTELPKGGSKTHHFIVIHPEQEKRLTSGQKTEKEVSLKRWKADLEKKYLNDKKTLPAPKRSEIMVTEEIVVSPSLPELPPGYESPLLAENLTSVTDEFSRPKYSY